MNTPSKTAPFLLGTHNVIDYLSQHNFCNSKQRFSQEIELKACKNFNLIVRISPDRYVLVKQEPHGETGTAKGDLAYEWWLHKLIQKTSPIRVVSNLMSDMIQFDPERSIAIFNYLTHYVDLDQFYTQHFFPTSIAAALGVAIATIHRATFHEPTVQKALAAQGYLEDTPDFGNDLRCLTPDIFGQVTSDGLKFYELYQRYDSLGQAIDRLSATYQPCCITHQDLKFNNILLHNQWQDWSTTIESNALQPSDRTCSPIHHQGNSVIRLIDWEKWAWGDPAFDVGTIIASYLKIWLKSLALSPDISIEMALQLASTPLDVLQPSLKVFMYSYLAQFPQILQEFPNFLTRVMQFTGLALIESLQARIHYYEPFGNVGIGMLEVAKTLLCSPEPSIASIFGMSATELTAQDQALVMVPELSSQQLRRKPTRQNSPLGKSDFGTSPMAQQKLRQTFEWNARSLSTTDALQDIVHHLHILPSCHIYHECYKPLELSKEIRDRFEKFPHDLKRSFLRTQLRNYLYDLYYSGEYLLNHTTSESFSHPSIKNDTVRGINLEFYQSLDRANSGRGYHDPGWRVISQKQSKEFIVQKKGISLQVRRQHLAPDQSSTGIGDVVAIQLPHHLLESDFYVAVSNSGPVRDDRPTLEICFHITADGAVEIMRRLTHGLNRLVVPFTFKVLLHPTEYHRYDAGILHLERQHYALVRPVLQQVYSTTRSHFRPAIPFLTKLLAPGLSLAEEPPSQEFGLHRCQLLAEALLAAQAQGDESPTARMNWIEQCFREHGISLQQPYLSSIASLTTSSTADRYTPLDRC